VVSSRYVKGALISLAALGMTAAITGGVLGIGFGSTVAGAAPREVPSGTLGIGEHTIAPMGTPTDAGDKVAVVVAERPSTMVTHVARKDAPLPKPKPKPAPKPVVRASGSSASRSTASSSGWSSARVSWYGPGFYGRSTASGATLTQGMMNVAHRSLAFGTRIQFEYNGKTCVAVVNDRGPYVGGRTFDLGPGTAGALGFSGVGTVKYRILGR